MEKNKVKVLIYGTEYTLVSNEEPEYVQRVAVLVDKKLTEIYENSPRLSTALAAMLAMINLADDYIKLDDTADDLREQIANYLKNEGNILSELKESKANVAKLEAEVQALKIELAKKSGSSSYGSSGYNKR